MKSRNKLLQLSQSRFVLTGFVLIVAVLGVFLVNLDKNSGNSGSKKSDSEMKPSNNIVNTDIPSVLERSDLKVDFSKSTIDLKQALSGGPGKDGIPAITNPKFESLSQSDVSDDTQVVYVENNSVEKLYPLSILVWHEIVNDTVGDKSVAVTFCPLCGSAIVFDRDINGEIVDFGVSGFLYESNLLMYSREDSESLWSQSLGQAVVGSRSGTTLEYYPMQLISFADAKQQFPGATIMSTDTGFSRNYDRTPYSGYSDTEATYYPVSVSDKRFPAKEVFYIVPIEGSSSIAVRQNKADGTYDVPGTDIKVTLDKGLITAKWGTAIMPGYYEMWFSWATHNSQTGIVLD